MSVEYSTPESRSSTDPDTTRDAETARNHKTYHEVPTCACCGRWRNPNKSVEGSYCSTRCYYTKRGAKALKNVATDHRFCRSCMAQVKEIERPPDGNSLPECVVGYQYTTPEAERCTREYERTHDDDGRGLLRQRIGCSCGATDLTTYDETLATADLEATLINLVDVLVEKYHEEKLDERVDHRELFDTYRDSRDLEHAVGRGLYA